MKFHRLLILLVFVVGCQKDDDDPSGADAAAFINEVVDIMETNSVNKKDIDWQKFRTDAVAYAASSKDINSSVSFALDLLGDKTSYAVRGSNNIFGSTYTSCDATPPPFVNGQQKIAYIKVPTFGNSDDEVAATIQGMIKRQDSFDLLGWIVDLRGNANGNIWPMLAGLGPLLGDGIAGYFIDGDGKAGAWVYSQGQMFNDGKMEVTVKNPYTLITTRPKIAVLTDNGTGNTGEGLAIAFHGLDKTSSFGRATCGVSTGKTKFSLSDGSILWLNVSRMADRNKVVSEGPLSPDVAVQFANDDILHAVEWIKQTN